MKKALTICPNYELRMDYLPFPLSDNMGVLVNVLYCGLRARYKQPV